MGEIRALLYIYTSELFKTGKPNQVKNTIVKKSTPSRASPGLAVLRSSSYLLGSNCQRAARGWQCPRTPRRRASALLSRRQAHCRRAGTHAPASRRRPEASRSPRLAPRRPARGRPSQHGGGGRGVTSGGAAYKAQDFRFRSFPAVTTSPREHACEFPGAGLGGAPARPRPSRGAGVARAPACPPPFPGRGLRGPRGRAEPGAERR